MRRLISEFTVFSKRLFYWLRRRLFRAFFHFERGKGVLVTGLYGQRGRFVRPFLHSSMAVLAASSILLAPVIAQELPKKDEDPWQSVPSVLSAETENPQTATLVSDKPRDKIVDYSVQSGDTVSSIAQKYAVSEDTIRYANDLGKNDKLKPGQIIKVLPMTGISHTVKPGDTIYSIAKKYSAEPQALVDFPFNTFANDETFELAVGQTLIVPEGVPPKEAPSAIARRRTPDAGSVVASGNFAWPASGELSQGFFWYHPGIDIANRGAPDVLAADSGTVEYAGCTGGGYGCHVIINHGNGSKTLYGHFQKIYVDVGQGVSRGSSIGKMGSTGRSTGIHLHFEVIQNGVHVAPLSVLH